MDEEPNKQAKVTLVDVAARAGVSRALASLAIRGESGAGIFAGTNLLQSFENALMKLSQRTSPFASLLLSSLGTAAFSCNQTLAILLTYQLAHKTYASCRLSASRLALDLENSVVLPLCGHSLEHRRRCTGHAALGANASFIPYALPLPGSLVVAVEIKKANGIGLNKSQKGESEGTKEVTIFLNKSRVSRVRVRKSRRRLPCLPCFSRGDRRLCHPWHRRH